MLTEVDSSSSTLPVPLLKLPAGIHPLMMYWMKKDEDSCNISAEYNIMKILQNFA